MKNKLPKAKTTEIVEQDLENELLLYHLTTNKMYSLNETSKTVYKACDGATTFDDLKREHNYSDELIYLALDELKKNDLLETGYVSSLAGMNRREVIRRIGLASMIALPLISSVVAPTSAHAASGPGPTDCTLRGGTCVPAGQNICTGVVGQRFDLYYYSPSNAGACRGADSGAVTPNFTCTNDPNNTSFFDVCRVPR